MHYVCIGVFPGVCSGFTEFGLNEVTQRLP